MGYSGLEYVSDSDSASDLASNTFLAMVKCLNKGLKEKGNEFNTDGSINVALFIEQYLDPKNYYCGNEIAKLIENVKTQLEEKIKKISCQNWDDSENKKYHIKCYKRMLKNLEKF